MDQATARTALYDFGRDQYKAACSAVLGAQKVVQVRFGDVAQDDPDNATYWARISRRTVAEFQETLRNGSGQRRFCSTGIVFVQLFCPNLKVDSKSLNNMDRIAEIVRNSFRTYQGEELEFTNAEITDNVNPEPNWLRANISSAYSYRQFIS
jgi:hypothetical protein